MAELVRPDDSPVAVYDFRHMTDGVIETEDGFEVDISDDPEGDDVPEGDPLAHDANLAEHLSDTILAEISGNVCALVEDDLASRKKWEDAYKQGIKYLGFDVEKRTIPWENAAGVFHPIMAETVVRFEAEAITEIFPPKGPVQVKISGELTREREKAAKRIEQDLNHLLTERVREYRAETEKLLFNMPIAGSAFRKVCMDYVTGKPSIKFVPAEDVVVPYGASTLYDAERITHMYPCSLNVLRKHQAAGFYRDIDIQPSPAEEDDVGEEKLRRSGYEPSGILDDGITIYETQCELDIEGFEDTDDQGEPTGIALPYVVTIDKGSGTVLSLRRNWREDDPTRTRRDHFVHYPFIPGLGFYGSGLPHLIGGLAQSATSILRQLIDAGTLNNLQGGFKAKGGRVKVDNTPIMPGEWRDIEVYSGKIADSLYPLNFKEPSGTLKELLGALIDEARRFASMADVKIADSNQEAPVGTTLALLERSQKVMTGIQARLHASLKDELRLIFDLIREHDPSAYVIDVEGDAEQERPKDFSDWLNIVPVSDPSSASMTQRMMQYQAALELSKLKPELYDQPELHRSALSSLGVPNVEKLIPNPAEQKPTDPVAENMAIMTGKPVQAFPHQDHDAHITAHMAVLQDPKIVALVSQSPNAQSMQAAMSAHVQEHIAFQYRRRVESAMGVPLPEPNVTVSPEMEGQVAKAIADAAEQVLRKEIAKAKAEEFAQNMEDPVFRQQQRETDIKEQEVQRKAINDLLDYMSEQADRESEERQESIRAGAQIIAKLVEERAGDMDRDASTRAKGAEIGADLMKEVLKTATQEKKIDADKRKASNNKSD